jgi:predicted deacylase
VRGKTVLVAEAGRSGMVVPSDLTALIDGSLNVLGALKMLDRPTKPVAHPIWLSGAGARVAADSAGVFFAAVDRDAKVTKGQLLGHTTDFLGQKTGEIRSPIDGLVTFIRGVPSMWPRATLVNVLPILTTPAPWKAP